MTSAMTSPTAAAARRSRRLGRRTLAGERRREDANGGHQRVEGDAANSPMTKATAEEQRTAAATRKKRRRSSGRRRLSRPEFLSKIPNAYMCVNPRPTILNNHPGCTVLSPNQEYTIPNQELIKLLPIVASFTKVWTPQRTPVGLSPPLLSLVLRNEPCYTKDKAVAHAGLWLAR
uniref:Calcineurin B-like n=1 Tax=Oryza sativa subsp. japonica TaxID=39947 RepID=Q5VS53_ORYSJ|nr:calcineurin B-like [Oryza sativa Japonica Group]